LISARSLASFFLLILFFFIMLGLSGCSSNEEFGSIVATTDLPVGYTVLLQTETTALVFVQIGIAQVDGQHTVRFNRVTPGEYRLVAQNASGQPAFASPAFGAGVTTNTLTFNVPSTLDNPL
jgi:hypothetical protein